MEVLFVFSLLFIAFPLSHSATIFLDALTLSLSTHSTAHIGDTIIMKHKEEESVYIFRNREAFNGCNFTQATLLSHPNSTSYTWHPSRPGIFYFAVYNGTPNPCQDGHKLAVKVPPPPTEPPVAMAPPPTSSGGGFVASSPAAFPWPFQPREKAAGPSATTEMWPAPAVTPEPENGGSIPFISSNPAVPLPTGEVDSATIRPLPTDATSLAPQGVQEVGLLAFIALLYNAILMV